MSFTLNAYIDQHISCYGNADGYIQAECTPSGNYEFTLKRNKQPDIVNNTGTFKPLKPGTYKVYAVNTDDGEEMVSSKLKVTQPLKLKVKFEFISSPEIIDGVGTVQANITGGSPLLQPYLVTWKDVNGNIMNDLLTNNFATVMDLPAGKYSVTIEDDNGCFLTKSFKLPIHNPLG